MVYNIPPDVSSLPEGVSGSISSSSSSLHGMKEGRNDWKHVGYEGPQPPRGVHRYFHKLYALDTTLGKTGHVPMEEEPPPTKAVLEKAMQGHILAQAEYVGKFGQV